MNTLGFNIVNNGDRALTIVFKKEIGHALSVAIINICKLVKERFPGQIEDIIPSYQSMTICFTVQAALDNQFQLVLNRFINYSINALSDNRIAVVTDASQLIEIPVCYDKVFAPDLSELADYCHLTESAVVSRHSNKEYLVHMLGFLPGFLYLGGLDNALNCPRKTTPSSRIYAGSVGIGGNQTGIYPVQSPGGWHIIGRTPIRLFDPEWQSPVIASPLDRVKFVAISEQEFKQIEQRDNLRALPRKGHGDP